MTTRIDTAYISAIIRNKAIQYIQDKAIQNIQDCKTKIYKSVHCFIWGLNHVELSRNDLPRTWNEIKNITLQNQQTTWKTRGAALRYFFVGQWILKGAYFYLDHYLDHFEQKIQTLPPISEETARLYKGVENLYGEQATDYYNRDAAVYPLKLQEGLHQLLHPEQIDQWIELSTNAFVNQWIPQISVPIGRNAVHYLHKKIWAKIVIPIVKAKVGAQINPDQIFNEIGSFISKNLTPKQTRKGKTHSYLLPKPPALPPTTAAQFINELSPSRTQTIAQMPIVRDYVSSLDRLIPQMTTTPTQDTSASSIQTAIRNRISTWYDSSATGINERKGEKRFRQEKLLLAHLLNKELQKLEREPNANTQSLLESYKTILDRTERMLLPEITEVTKSLKRSIEPQKKEMEKLHPMARFLEELTTLRGITQTRTQNLEDQRLMAVLREHGDLSIFVKLVSGKNHPFIQRLQNPMITGPLTIEEFSDAKEVQNNIPSLLAKRKTSLIQQERLKRSPEPWGLFTAKKIDPTIQLTEEDCARLCQEDKTYQSILEKQNQIKDLVDLYGIHTLTENERTYEMTLLDSLRMLTQDLPGNALHEYPHLKSRLSSQSDRPFTWLELEDVRIFLELNQQNNNIEAIKKLKTTLQTYITKISELKYTSLFETKSTSTIADIASVITSLAPEKWANWREYIADLLTFSVGSNPNKVPKVHSGTFAKQIQLETTLILERCDVLTELFFTHTPRDLFLKGAGVIILHEFIMATSNIAARSNQPLHT